MKKMNYCLFATCLVLLTCSKNDRNNPIDPNGSNWDPPIIAIMKDTIVAVNDSFYVHAEQVSKGRAITGFIWEFSHLKDNSKNTYLRYTTTAGKIKVAYKNPGYYWIKVWAIDENGVLSGWWWDGDTSKSFRNDPGYITVNVHEYAPKVLEMTSDTTVNINDSIRIIVYKMLDTNGTVTKLIWSGKGSDFTDTTLTNTLKIAWPDSGKMLVVVKVMDDDGFVSKPDTCIVRVKLDPPVVKHVNDTTVAQTSTVSIKVSAIDTNAGGTIAKYYWDIGANGWDDSSIVPMHDFSNVSGGPTTIVWAAIDDDKAMTSDTFRILFNRPPAGGIVTVPTSNSSWVTFDLTTGTGSLPFTMQASDMDLPYDTLGYSLSLGKRADSLSHVYIGMLSKFTEINIAYSDIVYWQLISKDKYGDSSVASGTIVSPPPPPPVAPVLKAPVDTSKDVSLTATLTWDTVPTAVRYQVQVSTNKSFATLLVNDSVTVSNKKVLSGLARSTIYYWRIKAKNAGGVSNWSTVYSFTTIPLVPSAPTLVSPSNGGKIKFEAGEGYVVTWNAIADVKTYHIQCSIGKTFTGSSGIDSVFLDYTGVWSYPDQTHSKVIESPFGGVMCYWRVSAINAGGESSWSPIWTFIH